MSEEPTYLISTTLGDCRLPASSSAFLQIDGKTVRKKQVRDVQEGDTVLFHAKCIDTTLEQIEPALEQSARYTAARDALHVVSSGKRITRLRHDLITALAPECKLSRDKLEDKLFQRGADFTDEEYKSLASTLREKIHHSTDETDTYNIETLKNWLRGETVAPEEWTVFDQLETAFEHFQTWNKPSEQVGEELKDHYRLYMTVRKGVQHYLATKGASRKTTKENKNTNGTHLSLDQEIQLVINMFVNDVTKEYKAARITSIKKISATEDDKKGQSTRPQKTFPPGIVTTLDTTQMIECLSLSDLELDRHILELAWTELLTRFINKTRKSDDLRVLLETAKATDRNLLRAEVLSSYVLKTDDPTLKRCWPEKYFSKTTYDRYQSIANYVYTFLTTNKLDPALNLPCGIAIHTARTLGRLYRNQPPELRRAQRMNPEEIELERKDHGRSLTDKERKRRRELGIERQELTRKLFTDHGFDINKDSRWFIEELSRAYSSVPYLSLIQQPEFIRTVVVKHLTNVQPNDRPFICRGDVRKTLTRYNLCPIQQFIPSAEFIYGDTKAIKETGMQF